MAELPNKSCCGCLVSGYEGIAEMSGFSPRLAARWETWEGSNYLHMGKMSCPSGNKSFPCHETQGLYLNRFPVLAFKAATELDPLASFNVVNDGQIGFVISFCGTIKCGGVYRAERFRCPSGRGFVKTCVLWPPCSSRVLQACSSRCLLLIPA